jgi:O-methyltransferase
MTIPRRPGMADRLQALFMNPRVQRTGAAAVARLASRVNYHVVRGMSDSAVRPDVSRFAAAAPWKITHDYVRDSTLALLCHEVADRAVPGALAELGVFRGDFALLMSSYLPGRTVHLFDTFSGFEAADVALDRDEGLVEDFIDFSSTHPLAVKQRFPDGDLVRLHVGYFPATTEGVEETFAMVSIDADLYAPVLSGLQWFYPRLSPGGAILVHDYNNTIFGGAKKAVREFQIESGAPVVPLADWGGTAVLVKPGAAG